MDQAELAVGDRIVVRDLAGRELERVVVSLSEDGQPILASSVEIDAAENEGRSVRGIGWPTDAIVRRVNGNGASS
jgi:hypothetical protein